MDNRWGFSENEDGFYLTSFDGCLYVYYSTNGHWIMIYTPRNGVHVDAETGKFLTKFEH